MVFADCIADESDAGTVLLSMPPSAACTEASGESLIDFGIGEGFGLAIVPAEAAECGQVAREILLDVNAETIFSRDVPGMIRDFWNGRETGFEVGNGFAIDSHVGVVGIGQEADGSGFFRNHAMTQFVFKILGMNLPRSPHKINSVRYSGH